MKKTYLLFTLVYILLSSASYSQFTTLLNFEEFTNGSYPRGSLISDGTFLYGMTQAGGMYDYGTIFKIMPDGTSYVKLLDFEGTTNGRYPNASLFFDGIYLYGMTVAGGAGDFGTVFKIMTDGTGYEKLLDFDETTNGSNPNGSLISEGSFLCGMTSSGGTNNKGTIFKIMPDGTGYVKLLDFAGTTNGRLPYSSLLSDGTFLYGMTYFGGTNDMGTIFKIMPDGTSYSKLHDFTSSTNGTFPSCDLISDGTYLYGMTSSGGATNNFGTIFRILPNGTNYLKLFEFDGSLDGGFPEGSLISDGTFFYGLTTTGGISNKGTIFKIKPDGTSFAKLLDFAGTTNGGYPEGDLYSDGNFLYGMAAFGGTFNYGVVFKYGLTTGIAETNTENEFTIYPNPTTGIINISTSNNSVQFVSVTNVLGEIVFNKEVNLDANSSFTIDISEQHAGIYFLKIGDCTKRIIK